MAAPSDDVKLTDADVIKWERIAFEEAARLARVYRRKWRLALIAAAAEAVLLILLAVVVIL